MLDCAGRQACLAARFRDEKPGKPQGFEAQWARMRPIPVHSTRTSPGVRGMNPRRAAATFPCSAAKPSRCSAHVKAASMSTPPSGPAATAGPFSISPGTRVIGIDRDRTAIAGGFDLVDGSGGRLTLVEDRFSNLAEVCAAQGVAARGRRRDGCRGVLDAARPGRAAASRSASTARSTCGWAMSARPRPMSIAKASEADLANIIYIFGEERHSRAVARAIVAARKQTPIRPPVRWPISSRKSCGRSRVKSIRRPGRFRPCGFSSTRNSTSCIWRCRPPSGC